MPAQRMFLGQRVQRHFCIGTDDHQQVIEIVSHSAGEFADRIHTLRAVQLSFKASALGYIAVVGDEMGDLSCIVMERGNGLFCVEHFTVLFTVCEHPAKHFSRQNRLPQLPVKTGKLMP